MPIEIGKQYRFQYAFPQSHTLPSYNRHSNQTVTVFAIDEDNRANDQMESTWRIRTDDGWEGVAFDSELWQL